MEGAAPDRTGRLSARRTALAAALAVCALAPVACGRSAEPETTAERSAETGEAAAGEVVLTPEAAREGRRRLREQAGEPRSKARAVEVEGVGSEAPAGPASSADAPSPGAPTDAQVRAELASFKHHLATTAFLRTGPRARVLPDGTAVAPEDAPDVVKRVILAGNQIAKFPYKWGGGHGAWRDTGYDCSGSVSFALAGAGLLRSPLTSGGFLSYGSPGPGEWITIYTNPGHIFMLVAGLRFDTSGQGRAGTRWQAESASTSGFAVRHIPGL